MTREDVDAARRRTRRSAGGVTGVPRLVLELGAVEGVDRPQAAEVERARRTRRRRRRSRSSSRCSSSRTSSGASASISSRTARPNRRRRSSISTAASRSSASSSSSVRSALRVTRKATVVSISMPGNSWSRWAAITCSSGTKRSPSGMTTKRGSSGGTLTRAKRRSPVSGSRTMHRQVERQVRDVRERVAGVDGQRREHREDPLLEHLDRGTRRRRRRARPSREARCRPRPGRASTWSRKMRSAWSASSSTRVADRERAAAAGVRPSGLSCADAGRDLVLEPGHADLEELVEVLAEDGEELGPLEQRHRRVVGQGEHPGVEVEPRQLAVRGSGRGQGSNPRRSRPKCESRGKHAQHCACRCPVGQAGLPHRLARLTGLADMVASSGWTAVEAAEGGHHGHDRRARSDDDVQLRAPRARSTSCPRSWSRRARRWPTSWTSSRTSTSHRSACAASMVDPQVGVGHRRRSGCSDAAAVHPGRRPPRGRLGADGAGRRGSPRSTTRRMPVHVGWVDLDHQRGSDDDPGVRRRTPLRGVVVLGETRDPTRGCRFSRSASRATRSRLRRNWGSCGGSSSSRASARARNSSMSWRSPKSDITSQCGATGPR